MRLVSASTLDGTVGAMGTDPTGRLLYVSTSDPAGAGPRSIYEFDAASGALLRRTTGPVGVAVAGVSAMADGVWVAVATGLLGAVDFYRASDLKHTATYEVKRGGPATNGIDASVVNGTLWVTDGMIGAVACTDPATGRVREVIISGFNSGYGFSNVVGVGSNVYVGIDGGVLAITPSARCLG